MADYYPPYIDETGLHTPAYTDIRDQLIEEMKGIYGDDIYISEDSMDYQLVSIFAKKIYDTNNLASLAYNNRTPINAVGVGLDNICAIVGITRKPATSSTVQLTITGDAGTVIEKGAASDGTYQWDLPSSVTIPDNGIITVEATCDVAGNIGALPNTITTIVTPTYGWLSVTNNYAASNGTDVESDAALRGRYSLAVSLPSSTVMDGIQAAIENVEGTNRIVGYENDTSQESDGTTPPNIPEGLPPHSISFVVEGGNDEDVASAIYNKKTPGCYTNGNTEVKLISDAGNINTIRFFRPEEEEFGDVNVKIIKLSGYNEEYDNLIKQAMVEYINSVEIGKDVYSAELVTAAMKVQDTLKNPAFVIRSIVPNTYEVSKFYSIWKVEESNIRISYSS